MENKECRTARGAFFIMLGLIVLGLMVPVAAKVFRSYERTVTVKGLCEKEVAADKVIWPVSFKVVGNDLEALNEEINSKTAYARSFLERGGVGAQDISVSVPVVSDKYANEYGDNNRLYRYVATCTITVCSNEVDKVLALMGMQSELLTRGIVPSSEWQSQPQFLFEGLNDIKPEMIQEATRNARLAGEQFAKDSGSRLGKIRSASQGSFSIEDRDSNTPQVKRVRVVTSVVYYLNR